MTCTRSVSCAGSSGHNCLAPRDCRLSRVHVCVHSCSHPQGFPLTLKCARTHNSLKCNSPKWSFFSCLMSVLWTWMSVLVLVVCSLFTFSDLYSHFRYALTTVLSLTPWSTDPWLFVPSHVSHLSFCPQPPFLQHHSCLSKPLLYWSNQLDWLVQNICA